VIAQEDVDGSEVQAKGRSYAEAFNIIGDQLHVSWTAAPANYTAKAPVSEYTFTWKADGHSKTKTIKGTVTGAQVVDPGTKDSQYALIASGFTKTTAQARAMTGSGNIASALIQAAGAQVIKLVDTAPNAQVSVVSSGDSSTGPFSEVPNTYPIRFGVAGHDINELKAIVDGVVAEGSAPTLNVSTPLEIWIGAPNAKPAKAIDAAQWTADRMYGVSASDAEDGDASNGYDITPTVTSEAILAEVDTAKPGIYRVAYSVTDSDGNRVSKRRTVTVNDGTYTVGKSRVLEAHSFEVPVENVSTTAALKELQVKGLSGVTLYDGVTGDIIDDTTVRDYDGYTDAVADYDIIMGGIDPQESSGWVTKAIVGKVVDNTIIVGPSDGPKLDAPKPIVIPADPSNAGNADRSQIMKDVTAYDDDDDGDITSRIVINPDANGAETFPNIPLNVEGVYQVKFAVEDSDGNRDEITRAVVVGGDSFVIDRYYILQARSFIIGVSDVAAAPNVISQILDKSGAVAWDTNGATVAAIVQGTGSYKAQAGDYFPLISISGHPAVQKQIQATVVDDSVKHPENGDQYSIGANDFRINIGTANALKSQYGGAAYEDSFKALADAISYIRTGTTLAKSGSAALELQSVVNKDGSGTRFEDTDFTSGNVYVFTARFRVVEEKDTFVEVEVTVSNADAPVLTVPAQKIVPIGAAFDNDTTSPSYMSGVSASDIEDGDLPVTHDGPLPLDTSTRGAFKVTYSATDRDSNTATKQSMILVGDWIVASGYAITANDFTKRVGQVTGTTDEAISFAQAYAIDIRPQVGGRDNPNFGAPVAVTATDLDGYGAAVGVYNIKYAVAADPDVSVTKKATVQDGGMPVLVVPAVKKISKGQFFDDNTTNPSYMSGVVADDPEDGIITPKITFARTVATGVDGAYTVVYEVSDSDMNLVTKAGIVLVGPWDIGTNYAIRAYDFSKTLGHMNGSDAEMISSAKAESICIDSGSPNYGKAGTVTVADSGGYRKAVGSYNITFQVSEDSGARIAAKATVGTGSAPTLSVPAYMQAAFGSAFGDAQYMQGVSASDAEDGDITSAVRFDRVVNTGAEGYYAVNYSVKDSDGNTAYGTSIVFVGAWAVGNGYAINAHDFTKRLAMVTGTVTDMTGSAEAQAVCFERTSPSYGRSVAVTVTSDGGYPAKKTGVYRIVVAVQADLSVSKAITATVTAGNPPTLNVPATRRVPLGSGIEYMFGVSAVDIEDGNITAKVIHNSPVNTGSVGAYRVTYSVTDSDGNNVQKSCVMLVGSGWVVRGGYAIYAQDFAKKLSQVTGTSAEARRFAKAVAVWVGDQSGSGFGRFTAVAVLSLGGYKKAAGHYNITFAVQESTSVRTTIRASISDDTPKAPVTKVTNTTNTTNNNTQAPPPVVVNNEPAPPAATPQVSIEPTPVTVTYPTETAIEESAVAEAPSPQPEQPDSWYLIDLILAVAAMVLGLWLTGYALRRKDDEDLQNTSRGKQIRMWGVLGAALGIVAIVVLLLTQKFDGEMKTIDVWAILYAAIFGINMLAVAGVHSKTRDEWEGEKKM
jgi:hypothetical protein